MQLLFQSLYARCHSCVRSSCFGIQVVFKRHKIYKDFFLLDLLLLQYHISVYIYSNDCLPCPSTFREIVSWTEIILPPPKLNKCVRAAYFVEKSCSILPMFIFAELEHGTGCDITNWLQFGPLTLPVKYRRLRAGRVWVRSAVHLWLKNGTAQSWKQCARP